MRIAAPATVAALLCGSATLLPCPSQAAATTAPVLNGPYVFQKVENCGGGVVVQITGTWTFNNAAKTWTAKGYSISGVPLKMSSVSAKGTFSNTATQLTFDGSSPYNAFYGALTKGVANDLTLIALGTGPCGEQFTMMH
jgi:hypothetical protein